MVPKRLSINFNFNELYAKKTVVKLNAEKQTNRRKLFTWGGNSCHFLTLGF